MDEVSPHFKRDTTMLVKDFRWNESGNTIVAGPSFSGKTSIVNKIIRNKDELIKNGERKAVILFYLSDQKIYREWERSGLLAFKAEGVPDIESFKDTINFYGKDGAIVIFDDLGAEIKQNAKFFRELFLVLSHHMNLNVFLILHNIFPDGLRELSLNTHRFIITHNPRDSLAISTLSRQCFPGTKKFLPNVYKFIGEREFGYLVLDFHHNTNPALRVTTNWFFECGPYIMAFQAAGACSSSPYKCLHVISSDLYKSMINNAPNCEDKAASSASSSNSYSAPTVQNNFYPSDGFDARPGDGYKFQKSPDQPTMHNSPPDPPPSPGGHSGSDQTPDGNVAADNPPNGALIQPSVVISSDKNAEAAEGEEEFNGVRPGVGGDQISPIPKPEAIKPLTKMGNFKKRAVKKRKTPLRPSFAPYPPAPPQQQTPAAPNEPQVESMEYDASPSPPAASLISKEPRPPISLPTLKSPPKWPSFEERKPDIKVETKGAAKKTSKVGEKGVKDMKPLVKRKVKFERNLPSILEEEGEAETEDKVKNETKGQSSEERSAQKKELIKKPTNSLSSDVWIKTKPVAEEPMDTTNSVMETHQNELKMRFEKTPFIEQLRSRKYPQIVWEEEKDLRLEKKGSSKKENHLKHREQIKSLVKGPIQVRKDLFIDGKEKVKARIGKGPIRVRKDLFADSKEKVKDRMAVDLFKSSNGSEKKGRGNKKVDILKGVKKEGDGGKRKAPKKENPAQSKVEIIDVPYMPQHAAVVKNRAKMKKIIENHSNPRMGHTLKKEMIEEMEHEGGSSKRKNRFPTHPTGPIKFLKTKEELKGKRKNKFGTHPTGPIKFLKTKHEKINEDAMKDDSMESPRKSKKVYGSGFKLWKI